MYLQTKRYCITCYFSLIILFAGGGGGGGGGVLIFNTVVSKKGGLDKKEVEKNRGCDPQRNYDLLL